MTTRKKICEKNPLWRFSIYIFVALQIVYNVQFYQICVALKFDFYFNKVPMNQFGQMVLWKTTIQHGHTLLKKITGYYLKMKMNLTSTEHMIIYNLTLMIL